MWKKRFNNFIKEYQLVSLGANTCVYISKPDSTLILTIFVDDGIIYNVQGTEINHIVLSIGDAFKITIDQPKIYVRWHIEKNRELFSITIDYFRYVVKMLKKYNFLDSTPLSVLADPHNTTNFVGTENNEDGIVFPYSEVVRSLM